MMTIRSLTLRVRAYLAGPSLAEALDETGVGDLPCDGPRWLGGDRWVDCGVENARCVPCTVRHALRAAGR